MSVQSSICLLTGMALLGAAHPVSAQDTVSAQHRPDSATVAAGRELYQGRGGCVPCHGKGAEGTPEGPSLTAGPWKLGDGSLPWLLHIVRHAGWGTRNREGDPRPMRGPTVLDSAGVRQVAEYVFSISRRKPPSK